MLFIISFILWMVDLAISLHYIIVYAHVSYKARGINLFVKSFVSCDCRPLLLALAIAFMLYSNKDKKTLSSEIPQMNKGKGKSL